MQELVEETIGMVQRYAHTDVEYPHGSSNPPRLCHKQGDLHMRLVGNGTITSQSGQTKLV
jgi:hypothetical protein